MRFDPLVQPRFLRWTCWGLMAGLAGWLCGALAPAAAQNTSRSYKIGYVDVESAAARSRSIQQEVRPAENEQRGRQEELDLKIRAYSRARREYEAQRSVLSEAKAREEEKRLSTLLDEIDEQRLEIERAWGQVSSNVMEPAVDRILDTLRVVARQNGFDLVVRSDVVLYGAEMLDLTPLVVQALDRPNASPALPDPDDKP